MNKILSFSWGGMFALCAWLGTVQTDNLFARIALSLIAVLFFVPGALLLYNGITEKNRKLVLTIRWICVASLVLTTAVLIFDIVAALVMPAPVFIVSHFALIVVSSPLYCLRFSKWASLFLWACLLFATFFKKDPPQKKKRQK